MTELTEHRSSDELMRQPMTPSTPVTPMVLMQQAIDKGDVGTIGQLMELQERWEANEARKAYHRAMSRFQAECPSIERATKGNYGMYADLDQIRQTVRPVLAKNGLIATFVFGETEGGVQQVGCKVAHEGGYSEVNWVKSEQDISGSKNAIQSLGSTLTYLQRYAMIGALGITSADDDDDGASSGGPVVHRIIAHIKWARENRATVNAIIDGIATDDLPSAAQAWYELSKEEKMTATLAPTKGGIFPTEVLTAMRTTEFREAFYGPSTEPAGEDAISG